MPGNRSLDEFAAGEAADEGAEPGDGAAAETRAEEPAGAAPDAVDDTAVEPKAETFAWSASGGTCARCGETVESRWRDGTDLVCGGCKAW